MVEKTLFSDTDLKIEILKKGEDLTGFTCGNKTLDDFFHQEVLSLIMFFRCYFLIKQLVFSS